MNAVFRDTALFVLKFPLFLYDITSHYQHSYDLISVPALHSSCSTALIILFSSRFAFFYTPFLFSLTSLGRSFCSVLFHAVFFFCNPSLISLFHHALLLLPILAFLVPHTFPAASMIPLQLSLHSFCTSSPSLSAYLISSIPFCALINTIIFQPLPFIYFYFFSPICLYYHSSSILKLAITRW